MSSNRLGCGSDIQAFVTGQCGTPTVCALGNITSLTWNRILDDVSACQVEVPVAIGSGGTNPCCRCLADVEPWCHELHVYRNGVETWTGPIIKVTYGFTRILIEAHDMLAWTQVRIPETLLDYTTEGKATGGPGPSELTDIAKEVLISAFADGDPCVMDYVYQGDLQFAANRPTIFNETAIKMDAFAGTEYDRLTDLVNIGLNFTVLGRRIILTVDDPKNNTLVVGTLSDQHIMGEVDVSKDGTLAANRVFARYDGDDNADTCAANCTSTTICTVPCPALVEGTQYCYGPIEILRDDSVAFDLNTATQVAQKYVDAGSIVPRTMEFPGGSKLSPDAPFDINDLIPGNKMRVTLTNLCFPVSQEFKIQEVTYQTDASGEEAVGLTLANFNTITGSL